MVAAALRGGVTAVALREKDLDARSLLQLARALRPLTRRHGALLIVNDRADVARAAGADGVHLGQRSLPVDAARRALGRGLVGVSTHTLAEARAAERAGADYVFYGPIHDTPSKRGRLAPRGPRGLRRVAAALGIPVVAIGGIDPDRAAALGRAGAAGVAAIRGLVAARRPATAARAYRASWAAAAGAAARPRG